MKCALPGRYGKKNPIESSAILDSYYDTDIDEEKILSEDIGLSFEEVVNQFEKTRDKFIELLEKYKGRERELEIKSINDFEKLKMELLQKDKEEHDD